MNTAAQVDELIVGLKQQVAAGEITLSEAMWKAALACVGWPYVFGAWGALCTVKERKYRLNLNPSHTTIRTKCKAWDSGNCSGCQWYPNGERVRCSDCRGFMDWLMKQFGFDLVGEGATSQWNTASNWCKKGTVAEGIPQGVMVNLFVKGENGKMSHTGGYFNGHTIECSNGVQHFTKLNKKWTHWACAKCFENMEVKPVPNEPKEPETTTNYPTLRKGSRGDWVTILQQKLILRGYSCGSKGADGIYGNDTVKAVKAFQKANRLTADGVAGPKTWAAMDQAKTEPVKGMTYKVVLLGLSKGAAEEVVSRYGGTMTAE